MNKKNVKQSLVKFRGSITEEQEQELVKKLSTISDEKAESLSNVKIKSVKRTVVLSSVLGLFGGGSFYLGHIKRGIAKCIFNVVVPIAVSLIFLFWLAPTNHRYYNEGLEFQQFFSYSTPDMQYVKDYTYNGASLETTEKTQTLSHADFITDINNSQALFSLALEDLKGFLNAIPAQISILDKVAGDEEFEDKLAAINAEFAELSENANSLSNNITELKDEIEEVLTSRIIIDEIIEERESEEELEEITINEVIKKLREKLSKIKSDEQVKDNKDLVEKISTLSTIINSLSSLNTVNTYLNSLGKVNFHNAVNVGSGLEDIHAMLEILSIELKNPNLYDIYLTLQQLTYLINCVNWDDVNNINTLNSVKVSNDLQAKAAYIVPEIFENEEEDEKASVGDLITLILADLDNLYTDSEEKPEILSETIAILSELSENYNSSSLQSIVENLFPEQESEEDDGGVLIVNTAAEFEASLKSLLGAEGTVKYGKEDKEILIITVFNDVLNAAAAGNLLVYYQEGISKIYNSNVFSTCVTFIVSHAAATLLHYYTGLNVDFTYETGESLMYYYLSDSAPKSAVDEKLGITDTFRVYYKDAQNIINIVGNNIYLLSNLNAVDECLSEMASVINNLNNNIVSSINKWYFNWQFIEKYFAIMLAIDLIIIISYWIFEVYRDREKCYKLNYDRIISEVGLK